MSICKKKYKTILLPLFLVARVSAKIASRKKKRQNRNSSMCMWKIKRRKQDEFEIDEKKRIITHYIYLYINPLYFFILIRMTNIKMDI
jgi:hypothetical protein